MRQLISRKIRLAKFEMMNNQFHEIFCQLFEKMCDVKNVGGFLTVEKVLE